VPTVDFDAARRERLAGADPIEFKLGGQTFTARPAIPFRKLVKVVTDDERLPAAGAFDRAVDFIRSCLKKGDGPRLAKALENDLQPVLEDDVYGVVAFLVGCYTVRPTRPPSGSSDGRRTTGGTSSSTRTAGSGRKASGRSRPASRSTGSKSA
jgi:hypothetical protein